MKLTIDDLGSAGEGIGSMEGLRVFVDGALPGEEIEAQIQVRKKTYARATLKEITQASPERVTAPCPVFGQCGGCQLQHLAYSGQLKAKEKRIKAALQRIAGLPNIPVNNCIPSPSIFGYRNKIQLRVGSDKNGRCQLGLYAKRSHHLIAIENCLIHCSIGEAIYPLLKSTIEHSPIRPYNERNGKGELRSVLLRAAIHNEELLLVFVTNGPASPAMRQLSTELLKRCPKLKGIVSNINTRRDNVILGQRYEVLAGSGEIQETLSGLQFAISPASFFQVNTTQAEELYSYALNVAKLSKNSRVLDAYCGVGTLSLLAARHVQEVVGIESIPQAINDAKANAQNNGIENCRFLCGRAEELAATLPPCDVILINPPRGGCSPSFLHSLSAQRLVYISCDPATLARDLKILSTLGYRATEVQPFDMFPQTMHVESVCCIERNTPK